MLTWEDLKAFVGAGASDDEYVAQCWTDATTLVEHYVGSAIVPANVINRAILMCGSEMYHAKNAPNGIAQFAGMDGAPTRIARNPMLPAYALLNQYMVVGF